jgi:hypothetical protein
MVIFVRTFYTFRNYGQVTSSWRYLYPADPLKNDCALTVRESDARVMLLSTLPGQRYRETFMNFDDLAALTLHRREIDNYIAPLDISPIFEKLLGSDHTLLHDSLLNYIPVSEVSNFGQGDLGKGSFGAVSTAIWHRKRSLEYKSSLDIQVVLKRLQSRDPVSSSADLFAKEVSVILVLNCQKLTPCSCK